MSERSTLHHHPLRSRSLAALFLLLFFSASQSGCTNSRRISAENDRLRNQVVQLQDQVTQLTRRTTELQGEVNRAAVGPGAIPEELRGVIPYVTGISIGRLSHAMDANRTGRPDTLVVYIHPVDGRGRFTQLVGPVSITAALLPPNAEAITLGQTAFPPSDVRDAYRSSVTGTYYVFNVPIQLPADYGAITNPGEAVTRAVYTDGLTGQTFSADRSIALRLSGGGASSASAE